MIRMAIFQVMWLDDRLEWEDLDVFEFKNQNEEQDEEMHRASRMDDDVSARW